MDKTVIFAVAGSGKTTYIINNLNCTDRSLVITYTNNNLLNIRTGIIKKFGFFPENIKLLSYFTFIYSLCYKPFFLRKFKTEGINYKNNSNFKIKVSDTKYYFFDKFNRIYSNRISKFLEIQGSINDINLRISKYFDNLFIDEVQDLAGNDFNFLRNISKASINTILVGDFFSAHI